MLMDSSLSVWRPFSLHSSRSGWSELKYLGRPGRYRIAWRRDENSPYVATPDRPPHPAPRLVNGTMMRPTSTEQQGLPLRTLSESNGASEALHGAGGPGRAGP